MEMPVTCHGTVELRGLRLDTRIGTYGPGDVVPDEHVLDMTLSISPDLILTQQDGMANVFDYDPLLAQIERLARDGHYETQEWLITRIVNVCASDPQIQAVEIVLRKSPVLAGSGSLGVRLTVDQQTLADIRRASGQQHTYL